MTGEQHPGFETLCVHHAEDREAHLGAAVPPLYQASTFTYPDCEHFIRRSPPGDGRFDYTRTGNPTTQVLEQKIAALEGGEACRAFGSGMAAISAAILSCVKAGDHLVTIDTVYGPTRTLLAEYLPRFGITASFVRGTETSDFETAIRENTRLLYLESPSSKLFELQDLAAVAELARSRGLETIADNSWATPFFQTPLSCGIDLVVHTATKYIGGHSDVLGGFVIGNQARIEALSRWEGELLGGVCDPFASWLMLRGLRTLGIRMERHEQSAMQIARFLETDARIGRVYYPGLESHPQRGLAKRQMRGTSGLLSVALREPTRERTFAVVNALKLFCIAVSWGGYESLAIPMEVRDPTTGAPIWLIRLSVGLESVEDLKTDLYQALSVASA